jgi:hypothetical protein
MDRDAAESPQFTYNIPWSFGTLRRPYFFFELRSHFNLAMVGFRYENFVRIQGIADAAYNGKLGKIKSLSVEEHNGRFRVELQVGEVASDLSREMLVKPENMARACDCCHNAGAATMQYCGKCRNAAYCNAECQRSDWMRHKVECSEMNGERQLVKSPLILAVGRALLAEVQHLVREGADVNKALKENGNSPIFVAANGGHLAIVQFLVQHGADKNKVNNEGASPLYAAARKGHLSVVQFFVQQGADKDETTNDGVSALCVSAAKGHLAVVQYLLQHGADKNKATKEGFTPLYVAAQEGHLAVVLFLVRQGADKNKATNEGATPLIIAAQWGHLAVVQELVMQGADKDMVDDNGSTPILIAANCGHLAGCSSWHGIALTRTRPTMRVPLHSSWQLRRITWRLCNIWCSRGLTRTRPWTVARLLSSLQLRSVTWL